jgi:hypothetical protein
MRYFILLLLCCAASTAEAQLMFQTTLDQYEHPKSQWERWSQTKVGDYIEYTDGKSLLFRFEAVEVGDHEMKIRTTSWDGFQKQPQKRDIKHVFNQGEPKFGLPNSVSDDKLKLDDKEFDAQKEQFIGIDKKPVKEVWFSEAAPFDGMLKYQQYVQGAATAERLAGRFKKGSAVFGKPDEKTAEPVAEQRKPGPKLDPKPVPAADPPVANKDARTWTSANGKEKIEAKLVRTTSTTVVLQRASDGKEVTLRLNQLSKEDREYLKELAKKPK